MITDQILVVNSGHESANSSEIGMSSNSPIASIFPLLPINIGAKLVSGYAFKSQDFGEIGYPVIKIKNIQERQVTTVNSQRIPEAIIKQSLNKFFLSNNDVLIAMTGQGSVGRVGRLRCSKFEKPIMNQRVGKFVADEKKLNLDFLYYVISSPVYEEYLFALGSGSGQPNLSPNTILSAHIPFPDYEIQKEIGLILNSLEDRIHLLRETNSTLEAIAQALFKSWFVDFDPVHAKQQGREPEGMDDATAALFPDSFEESELGLVPKGWRVGSLGEFTKYLSRGISPKYLEDGGVLVINQKCIRDFTLDLSKARRHDPTQRKIEGREILIGDILVNSTGVGTLGRVAQVLSSDEPTIVDSHVTIVRVNEFLTWNYLGLSMMRRQHEIEELGEGTTGQTELSRSRLSALQLVIPSKDILFAFDEIALPLRQRFASNNRKAQTLSVLRDTLLPRLISGQLRLPEAETMLEEACA